MLHKNAGIDISQQYADPHGRFLFLKGQRAGMPITLVNVYFPNTAHVSFCQTMIEETKEFRSRM